MSDHEENFEGNSEYGFEDTPEANKAIWFWGFVSVMTLLALIPMFHSYYEAEYRGALERKTAGLDRDGDDQIDYLATRNAHLEEQRRALAEAPTSIEDAMAALASRGRAVPPVRPRRNDGLQTPLADALTSLAAVKGWARNEDEPARAAAERALMAGRARDLGIQLERAAQEAIDLGVNEDAARSRAVAHNARSNPNADTLEAAESWLRAWPTRRRAAQSDGASPE